MQPKHAIKTLRTKFKGAKKTMYQLFRYRSGCVNRFVFIVGCQRSGTTMLGHCFDEDYQTKEYGEYGLAKTGLRIPPLDAVRAIADGQHAPVFVAKPLVESQRTTELLDFFPDSSAIWMLRHYKDVANSSFRKFGVEATQANLGAVVRNDRSHWMAEGISDSTREIVCRYYADDMPPLDGKALIWYVRNILFFEQKLENRSDVRVIHYNDIAREPASVMRRIYEFIDVEFPGDRIVSSVHKQSVGLGKELSLNPEIESLCEELWLKFRAL